MSDKAVVESRATPVSNINLYGVLRIPAVRQLMLLLGVAASVAVGVAVVLWSQAPGYTKLFSGLDTVDAAQYAEVLRTAGIEYKLDTDVGLLMVASSQLHDARLELASQNLLPGGGAGMDGLQGQSNFGVSQFMENALYQKALEEELARTISHLGSVREARVHLALPRQSSFVRDRNTATASVFLELNRGSELEADQASAIVHLVASSIQNLPASNVTVVDQFGRMLTSPEGQQAGAQIGNQMRHTQQLEETYKRRIEELLTPLVGPGRVKAGVVADLDFTITEETRESFDPEQTVVRSEQISEEEMRDTSLSAQGVPGALSNQPPETGVNVGQETASAGAEPVNRTRSSTRNFEVDRTISRVQPQLGRIQRLSVAILIDDSPDVNADGDATGLSEADVAQLTGLAKKAVGFDEARGDTIEVITQAFREIPEALPMDPPKIWENPMVIDIAKLLLGAAVALALGFGLVRPMFKGLLATGGGSAGYAAGGPGLLMASGAGGAGAAQLAIGAPSFDEKVSAAKNITNHDPARVAQIVRKWVSENG
jgi:flagellar M-ring protein FliF